MSAHAAGRSYYGDVDHVTRCDRERLGLLLAGGGRPCRRAVAQVGPATAPLDPVAFGSLPGPLVRAARGLLDREVPAVLQSLVSTGWRWLTPAHEDWPEQLTATSDPPLGLFVRGSLPDLPMVAVVGARRATPYGRQVSRVLGAELAGAGLAVVSGMARGVDAAAHEGTLEAGGPTVAVWGTGPDRVYPREHQNLAERIAASGALVTEFPPGTPPRRHHFPQRNRILAGLARAVVVVEAGTRSGALVTARLAVDEGREVLAVPGSIFSPLSAGPNALLRLGARPLLTTRDVLEELGLEASDRPKGAAREQDSGLLALLAPGEALAVDELAASAEQTVPGVLAELLELELEGRVERLADGRYARR